MIENIKIKPKKKKNIVKLTKNIIFNKYTFHIRKSVVLPFHQINICHKKKIEHSVAQQHLVSFAFAFLPHPILNYLIHHPLFFIFLNLIYLSILPFSFIPAPLNSLTFTHQTGSFTSFFTTIYYTHIYLMLYPYLKFIHTYIIYLCCLLLRAARLSAHAPSAPSV